MSTVERRDEAVGLVWSPDYSGRVFSEEEIAEGQHRQFVGGGWDTHGKRQLDYLVGQGLQPHHRFLDVGCGSLRAGRHLVDYLEPGNYYGIDANASLIEAGYDHELTDEQRERLPLSNLRANDRFDGDFGVRFDYALAQSVFTHVSLNHLRLCLVRLDPLMVEGGQFFATFFEQPSSTAVDEIVLVGQRPRFTERNIFWYYRSDMRWGSTFADWDFRYIGKWGHPVGQRMVVYTKREGARAARIAKQKAPRTPPPPPPGFGRRVARKLGLR